MVLYAINENFRSAEAFLLQTGRFFKLFSAKIATSCQQNKQSLDKLEIPCGTKFLRVLILTIFTIFPAIRKSNFPPKINENIFPAKIYSISSTKYTLTKIYDTKIQH